MSLPTCRRCINEGWKSLSRFKGTVTIPGQVRQTRGATMHNVTKSQILHPIRREQLHPVAKQHVIEPSNSQPLQRSKNISDRLIYIGQNERNLAYETDEPKFGLSTTTDKFPQTVGNYTVPKFDLSTADRFTQTIGNYRGCVLQDEKHVIEAQSLIHHIYQDEEKWKWNSINPTGFRVNETGQTKYITDNFENNSFWVGVFLHEKLISAVRVIYRTEYNKLDIEGYAASKTPNISTILNSNDIVEVQRYVTKTADQSIGVHSLTINTLTNLLYSVSVNAIATSQIKYFSRFGIEQVLDEEFDYGDGVHTNVLYWSTENIKRIIKVTKQGLELLIGK